MRILLLLTTAVTVISVFYRWRYRIMNTLLAIRYIRKIAVSLSMNMPALRHRILPNLFTNHSTN
ncbi:hypothetical protein QGM71_01950 [Virgibacillus sp. C22-A2]|uniref:Uncharacterized protein n=1 Tax=Virgibacillus tibetensis TaxID=3042313 RepID=A0ABU6KBG3_9BACI|nr:hypothetical protein [Virgibacillus sp. C22-A2]